MSSPTPPARRGMVPGRPVPALLLAVTVALVARSAVPAGPFPKDPVEQFRQALLLEINNNLTYKSRMDKRAIDLALAFRRKNLENAAKDLKTASDLSRALLLIDWPRAPKSFAERNVEPEFDRRAREEIERKVREELAARLIKEVQAATKNRRATGDETSRQVAMANLVGETVASAGSLGDESLLLYNDLKPLVNDLVTLADANSPLVREAAARALGQFPNSPDVTAEALRKLLASDQPESTRRAAADGLVTLAQTVSSSQPIRGSEPGVSVRETRRTTGQIFTLAQVAALVKEVAKAASAGLDDSSAPVRRQCTNALRQAAEALAFEIKVLLPGSNVEAPLPPAEREWSKDERERVEDQRKAVAELTKLVMPSLKAYRDQSAPLLRAALDRDPTVRLGARRTLEALAQSRELLQKQRSSVPTRPGGDKPDADKPGADKPGADKGDVRLRRIPARRPVGLVTPVSYLRQKDDKPDVADKEKKKDEAPDDKDDDPIGTLLKGVGDSLVRSGFQDPNAASRRASVEAVESMGNSGEAYIPQLVERLKDQDVFVRWIAARALGKLAPRQARLVVPALACVLNDEDLDPRIAAARALGLYGTDASSAVPAMSAQLLKGDAEFRIALMKAMEGIGTDIQSALPNLRTSLRDPDPRVRSEAARVIGLLGPLARDYVEALRELTNDPDGDVRKAASAAILSILSK